MKTRFFALLFLCCAAVSLCAETHIQIADPEAWKAQDLKDYVGQTVIFDAPMVVCANTGSTLKVSPRRLYEPTNAAYPRTPEYASVLAANSTGSISLEIDETTVGYHRCGERIYNLKAYINSTSLMTYKSGSWKGNTRAELSAGLPDVGDYRLLVCGFNLENYFVRELGGDLGAPNEAAHKRQRAKISTALKTIHADIFGLVELEDGDDALKEIVSDLNKNVPGRGYTYIKMTRRTASDQMADFVYDSLVVEPVGAVQKNELKTQNRKKMVCFREKATGETFIYSINHFKAKTGTGTGSDANQGDGQGVFNGTRVEEAQSVLDQYKAYSPAINEKDILIMGDLNAYGREDPIARFTNNEMYDLHRAFHADSSYSYRQRNKMLTGYLDHAICNKSLYPQITGMAVYHLNSDENDSHSYSSSKDTTMFRCSDHDPVLVGLKLDGTIIYDPSPSLNTEEIVSGKSRTLTLSNAYKEGENSYYAIYDISGRPISWSDKPIQIESNLQTIEKPAAPGVYIIYIYYQGKVYPYKFIVR